MTLISCYIHIYIYSVCKYYVFGVVFGLYYVKWDRLPSMYDYYFVRSVLFQLRAFLLSGSFVNRKGR